jgi:membrane associated rhomboid family serine protease
MIAPEWRPRWHDYLPVAALVATMVIVFLASSGEMTAWGVSAAVLAEGRYETIALHMFAHGGPFHLLMNSLALLEIGGLVVVRLGGYPEGWLRVLVAFLLAGLSSMIFFLSFHPRGTVPMIGASGAIYGLVGLLLTIRLIEEVEPVKAAMIPHAFGQFVQNNWVFLLLLLVGAVLAGLSGGVAWEAHLGGFLLGLCIGPWLLPPLIDTPAHESSG